MHSSAPHNVKQRRRGVTIAMLALALPVLSVLSVLSAASTVPTAKPLVLVDLDGRETSPFEAVDAKAYVFVFTRSDCPISNRYAPEMKRLYDDYAGRGAAFWLVYPDPAETAESIRAHLVEYDYEIPVLRDTRHDLVRRTEAKITPEAVVFDAGGRMVYRGRIDDRYIAFGKSRRHATRNDLALAIEATLAGEPVEVSRTEAVGCYIADLK